MVNTGFEPMNFKTQVRSSALPTEAFLFSAVSAKGSAEGDCGRRLVRLIRKSTNHFISEQGGGGSGEISTFG